MFIKSSTLFFAITLSYIATSALAEPQQIITDDGREVILNDDGTWTFISNDRFANTPDGRRVRLSDNGSWEYVGNAPMVTEKQVRTTGLELTLNRVVEEQVEKKVQKNVRVTSRMVFYVEVDVSPLQQDNISIQQSNITEISVNDDRGKNYPVLSVTPASASLTPDSKASLEIRADGAPGFLSRAKNMQIDFKPGFFGTRDAISLTYRIDDFDEKKLTSFD